MKKCRSRIPSLDIFYLFHLEHDFFKAFTLCGRWVVTNCSIQDENEHIRIFWIRWHGQTRFPRYSCTFKSLQDIWYSSHKRKPFHWHCTRSLPNLDIYEKIFHKFLVSFWLFSSLCHCYWSYTVVYRYCTYVYLRCGSTLDLFGEWVVTGFMYLRAIFCTFQISVDFYIVPVGGRGGWRGGAVEGEGARERGIECSILYGYT